jgi:hypothetical protein
MWKMCGSNGVGVLGRASAFAPFRKRRGSGALQNASAWLGRLVLMMVLLFCFAGCEKKGGEGIVLSKEFIPAVPPEQEVLKESQFRYDQWKVKVEMIDDMRKVNVLVERPEWEKIKVGDRVNVRYAQGKYTGAIWSSEIK